MSTFSNRKQRTRRLGQPLFPIEDSEITHLPTQPLADLTADLDRALTSAQSATPCAMEPLGLQIPAEIRAAYERTRQSVRSPTPAYQPRQPTNGQTTDAERSTSATGRLPRISEREPTSVHRAGSGTNRSYTPPTFGTRRVTPAGIPTNVAPSDGERPTSSRRQSPTQDPASTALAVAERPRGERPKPFIPAPMAPADELVLPLSTYDQTESLSAARLFNQPVVMLVIAVVSIVVIALWFMITFPAPFLSLQYAVGNELTIAGNIASATRPVPARGDYRLRTPPSLSPDQIDQILRSYGSPATGTGEIWYRLGVEYNIDPAYALAFFIHESGAGTNPNWAGFKPDGRTTHNVGNIICAGYPTCYGRFRDYPDWATGIADWYRLIDVEYIRGRGLQTVTEVIPIYAPSIENDVQGYINVVTRLVDRWRAGNIP